jgi:hypothetical protein
MDFNYEDKNIGRIVFEVKNLLNSLNPFKRKKKTLIYFFIFILLVVQKFLAKNM